MYKMDKEASFTKPWNEMTIETKEKAFDFLVKNLRHKLFESNPREASISIERGMEDKVYSGSGFCLERGWDGKETITINLNYNTK